MDDARARRLLAARPELDRSLWTIAGCGMGCCFRRGSVRVVAVAQMIADDPKLAEGHPPKRLPRMRFTVRGMMIAVGVTAVALGSGVEAYRLKQYRDQFLAKANDHARREIDYVGIEKTSLEQAASYESMLALTLACSRTRLRRRNDWPDSPAEGSL